MSPLASSCPCPVHGAAVTGNGTTLLLCGEVTVLVYLDLRAAPLLAVVKSLLGAFMSAGELLSLLSGVTERI